ncbi:sugar phosphate isomerase/epimerase [Candidatus Bathyarchaeota archaeon]|nr:MAG: sugar phosphate isomerase/epimerase [Candidatus Bathyarchaeota archaeon]
MKISICNEIFEGWRMEEVFKFISDIGYEGVEIAPFIISDDVRNINRKKREEIENVASSYGLKIVGTHWLLRGPKGLHITHPSENVRKRTERYLCDLVEFTSDIGGRIMVFGSPNQRNILKGVSRDEAWRYAEEIFSACSEFAEDYDVIIAFEPLARSLTNFINTAEEAIRLIENVSHTNFRLNLDVYSMLDEGKPLPDIIRASRDYLVHFHANDDNMLGPGFGNVDFKQIIDTLKEIGYENFISVEVFDFSPGPRRIATISFETLKQLLSVRNFRKSSR